MYIADLDLCHYHNGPLDADSWRVPLRAVGYLEHPNPFAQGTTPPGFLDKLRNQIARVYPNYPHYQFRGVHECSLCAAERREGPNHGGWSQENAFFPSEQAVFVCPGGIVHYVEAHRYRPPDAFIDAVLASADYGSPAFYADLERANGGTKTPLVSYAETLAEHAAWVERFKAQRGIS